MARASRSRVAWIDVKEYPAAVIAAAVMYGGIHQIISALKYLFTNGIVQLINVVIQRDFPDHFLLPDYSGIPWSFHARIIAEGVFVIVVGIFFGLWAKARSQRQLARQL